jgi:hypothetical protein
VGYVWRLAEGGSKKIAELPFWRGFSYLLNVRYWPKADTQASARSGAKLHHVAGLLALCPLHIVGYRFARQDCLLSSLCEGGQDDGDIQSAIHL